MKVVAGRPGRTYHDRLALAEAPGRAQASAQSRVYFGFFVDVGSGWAGVRGEREADPVAGTLNVVDGAAVVMGSAEGVADADARKDGTAPAAGGADSEGAAGTDESAARGGGRSTSPSRTGGRDAAKIADAPINPRAIKPAASVVGRRHKGIDRCNGIGGVVADAPSSGALF